MTPRLRLHVHDPGGLALRKAARTAVVMTVSFMVGRFAVDNTQFAVMATFTSAALLGIADFSGPLVGRLRAASATLVAGAALLALGTAVSSNTAAATVTMFVVTMAVAYSAVFSGYFAAASSAVIVFYVVATGFPGPSSTIPAREAGLAFGGVLSVLAVGWLWPSRLVADSGSALADIYLLLADAVDGLFSAGGPGPSGQSARIDSAILEAERAVSRSAWRPDGLAAPQKARLYLLQGARRLGEVVTEVGRLPRRSDDELRARGAALGGTLSASLRDIARGLRGGPLPEPQRVEQAAERFAGSARSRFAREIETHESSTALQQSATETFLLHQLAWGVALAVLHCRAMKNAPLEAGDTAGHSWLVSVFFDGPSLRKWIRRARRNFTPRSLHFQNALRLASGLALARLLVGVLNLQHGFWVGFATLVVLKTSAAGTRTTAVQAAAGTVIGFLVSSPFIAIFGVHDITYAVLLPIAAFAAFYLPSAVSFVAGQACFTLVIVVLFNLIKPAGWGVGLLRVEDVGIGAVVGLVIGVAIWPRGASTDLRRAVGLLVELAGTFAARTMLVLTGVDRGPNRLDPDQGGLAAELHGAAFLAEDVFSQYLSEPHQADAPITDWARLIGAAHRVWFGAGVASLIPRLTPQSMLSPGTTESIRRSTAVLEADFGRVGQSLRFDDAPLRLEPVPSVLVPEDAERAPIDLTLTLMEMQSWLDELSASFAMLGPALDHVGVTGASDAEEPAIAAV